jgi:hypothetical protein
MRKRSQVALILAAPVLAALPLAAAPLTASERSLLMAELDRSSRVVLASLEGVGAAQWRFKPGADRWSVAECAEHIVTADQAMASLASGPLLQMAPPPNAVKRSDEAVLKAATDRGTKVKTADFLEPKGRYADKAAVIAAFQKTRARIVEYVKSTQDDLRAHGLQTPAGYVDGYQFLLSLAAHGERHAQQIAEVKADPRYPKN